MTERAPTSTRTDSPTGFSSSAGGPPPPQPADRRPDGGPPGLPPLDPPAARRALRHRPALFRPVLLAAAVGLAFAVGTVDTSGRSLGMVAALTTLAVALVVTSARRPAEVWLGFAGVAFLPWLAIRMSPWLLAADLIAAGVLVTAALALPPAGSLRTSILHWMMRLTRAAGNSVFGPGHLVHATRDATERTWGGGIRRNIGSVSIGLLSLGIALAVLASGDALLASFLDVGELAASLIARLVAASIGIVLFSLGLGAVHVPGDSDVDPQLPAVATRPAVFGIIGLSIAIGCHAVTQAVAALLGASFVERRTGLTYAEYARSGFFQMAAIAAVSALAVAAGRSVARHSSSASRPLTVAAGALTLGVLVTVASAVVRLVVYTQTFGLTMLRLYTVIFACWLGLAAVMTFVALLRRHDRWLGAAVLTTAFLGVFAMNIANPEQIVAAHNLDRAETTGVLDVDYLSTLSADAAPEILGRANRIDAVDDDAGRGGSGTADAGTRLLTGWCGRVDDQRTGLGLGFNLSRHRAVAACTGD